jgi:hypothetical protein
MLRPRRCAADERDEVAALHSITSSAREIAHGKARSSHLCRLHHARAERLRENNRSAEKVPNADRQRG